MFGDSKRINKRVRILMAVAVVVAMVMQLGVGVLAETGQPEMIESHGGLESDQQSEQSMLQPFGPGVPSEAITIKKIVPGGSSETFNFIITVRAQNDKPEPTHNTDFSLKSGDSYQVSNVQKNWYYTVEEVSNPGWKVTDISCVNDIGGGRYPGDISTQQVTVRAHPNEPVTCTFTNEPIAPSTQTGGTITVQKALTGEPVPDAEYKTFFFTSSTTEEYHEVSVISPNNDLSLGTDGSITLAEVNLDAGWTVTGISCDNGDSSDTSTPETVDVHLVGGVHVTCTITNSFETPIPTITINKVVPEDHDGVEPKGGFLIRLDSEGEPLYVLPGAPSTAIPVEPGTELALSEDQHDGWELDRERTYCSEVGSDESLGSFDGDTYRLTVGNNDIECWVFNNPIDDDEDGKDSDGEKPDGSENTNEVGTPPTPPITETSTIEPDDLAAGPELDEDTIEELPSPPPAAGPDLPFTGGIYLWHLVAGAALIATGGQQLVLQRRRRTADKPQNN